MSDDKNMSRLITA